MGSSFCHGAGYVTQLIHDVSNSYHSLVHLSNFCGFDCSLMVELHAQMGVSTFLGDSSFRDPAVDEGTNEAAMWHNLKASGFYHNIGACMIYFHPLPICDWAKMLLLVPRTLQLVDFQKMCDEEDTITLCVSV